MGGVPDGCLVARKLVQRYIDILECSPRSDAAETFTGFDEVIAGLAGMFAAERVGENERFGELTRLH